MPNINTRRRSMEEARRRRALRQRAESLESRRGQFIDFMDRQGLSSEQRERELARLDELVESLQDQAEDEALDGL